MPYEALLREATRSQVHVYERSMPPSLKGLYFDGVVSINSNISTLVEKRCVLAEELGHHFTSSGDITNLKDIRNRKQELRARRWAYEQLVSLDALVEASFAGIKGRFELAEYLDVTEDFFEAAIAQYKEKYGLYVTFDRYMISFDPLAVIEMFE